jgi:hypothetical protein
LFQFLLALEQLVTRILFLLQSLLGVLKVKSSNYEILLLVDTMNPIRSFKRI